MTYSPLFDTETRPTAGMASGDFELGARLKQLRQANDMTVAALSQAAGVAKSTISKIESGQMSPTFDIIQKVAKGLNLDVAAFFADNDQRSTGGRRAVTPRGEGKKNENPYYAHRLLCAELASKKMFPVISRIKARSISEFKSMVSQEGEEFFYVLSGRVTVYSEFYEPLELGPGDSMYFDCTMAHATISTSDEDAEVLWVYAS